MRVMPVVDLIVQLLKKGSQMRKAFSFSFINVMLLSLFAVAGAANAVAPQLISVYGEEPDGTYFVGDTITIHAEFDQSITFSSIADTASQSPSKMTILLDTGPDSEKVEVELTSTTTSVMDMGFGKDNTANIDNVGDYYGIWTAAELDDGRVILAGSFSQYEGTSTSNAVVLDKKGNIVRTFTGSGFTSTNSPLFNNDVINVFVTSEGKIIFYGDFDNYSGNNNYDGLVQFNDDFTLDTTFMGNVTSNGSVMNSPLDLVNVYSANKPISEINGKLYIGGSFYTFNGGTHRGIVSLNLDGTFNTSFSSPITNNTSIVLAVRVDTMDTDNEDDDMIFLAGRNLNTSMGTRGAIKISQTGEVDTSFNLSGSSTGVNDLLVLPKGKASGVVVVGYGGSNLTAHNDDGSKKTTGWALQDLNAGWSGEAFEIIDDKLFVGAHNGWTGGGSLGYSDNGLIVINMEDGTLNDTFMDMIGRNGIFRYNGGTDVHYLLKLKGGGLLIMGSFGGYQSQTNDERAIVLFKFNRLTGTYTVRDEDQDLTGWALLDSVTKFQVDSVFGGNASTDIPDISNLSGGTLEVNSHYSLNRYPTDPVQTLLKVDKIETGTTSTIVATVTSITETGDLVGKSGDLVTFSVDNPLVTITDVVDNKDGTYSVTLSTTSEFETKTNISATVNGADVENNSGAAESLAVTFLDVTAPTVTMTSDKTTLAMGETAELTIVLSEDSDNFVLEDIAVVGGTITNITGSGKNYTATFTPTADLETAAGSATINIDAFTDAGGNGNSNAVSVTFNIDTKAPTVTKIEFDKTLVNSSQTSVVTIELSEASDDFTLEGIAVVGGTLSEFSGSGTSYTAVFTPTPNSTDDASVSVAKDLFTDSFGNNNIASSTATMTVDTVAPTASITADSSGVLGAGDSVTLTITLSEDSTDFIIDDLVPAGGTLSEFSGSGNTYTVVFTPTEGSTEPGSVSIESGKFSDAAGNTNTASADITLNIDTVLPEAALTADKTSLKKDESSTITIKLTESATDFTVEDLTVEGGTLSGFSGSGDTYTVVFTPTSGSTADGKVTVKAESFSDENGNTNKATADITLTIDAKPPTLAITADKTTVLAGKTATVTFTFDEAISNFDLSDVTVVGGALSSLMVDSSDPKKYTAIFTPTENSTASANFTVDVKKYTDVAGNENEESSSLVLLVDTVVPTAVITSNKDKVAAGETAILTITLSEHSTDFTIEDLSVVGGKLSGFSGSGNIYNVTFTPTAESIVGGQISIAGGRFSDPVGNLNVAPADITLQVDTIVPSATLVSNKESVAKGGTATITITLSEDATDLVLADLGVSSGTLSDLTGSGKSYTVMFTPTPGSTDDAVITLPANSFSDSFGNMNTVASTVTVKVDSVPPTIKVTSDKTKVIIGETANITFTLSEASTTFTGEDVTTAGGVLSNFTGSGTVYTAVFTPTANSVSTGNVTVSERVFTDIAGNENEIGDAVIFDVDTVAPTATITANKTDLNVGETATITITLSEVATDFIIDDLMVKGGTLSDFSGTGSVYTVTFTPTAGSTVSGEVSIAAGQFSDPLGNLNNVAAAITLGVDTSAPVASVVSDKNRVKKGETATITITLTEDSTDLVLSDLVVTGGTLSNIQGSGSNYTVIFTPAENSTDTAVITLPKDSFSDAAGNKNAEDKTISIEVDSIPPTLQITSNRSSVWAGEVALITFTFSEAISSFDLSDITVAGGTIGTLSSNSGKEFTAVFTPTANSIADGVVTVNINKYADVFGNLNEALSTMTVYVDTIAPTVTITANDSDLTVDETATLTITFSENVTGFDISDLTVVGGTLSNFAGSNNVYTVTFTPNNDSVTNGSVTIAAGLVVDAVGNNNQNPASITLKVDTQVPSGIVSSNKSKVKKDETATITITLSEKSEDFVLSDLTVSGGVLSDFSGSGKTYTVTFTPAADSIEDGKITLPVGAFTDLAGNANVDASTVTISVDSIPPTIAINTDISLLIVDGTATITFTLSEASSDFTVADIVATGGTIGSLTGSGTTYTAIFTPTDDSTTAGEISVAAGKFTDLAGNLNETGASVSIQIDTKEPTAKITSNKDSLKLNESALLTITFSETATNFNLDDITVTGGILSGFSGSGKTYTVTFTPTLGSNADGVISIPPHVFADPNGNENVELESITITVDTVAPTAQLSSEQSQVKKGETVTITVTLSEPTTDLQLTDLTATGGKLSNLVPSGTGNGTEYSVTFTPTANSTTDGVISLPANKFTDAAGNANTGLASLTLGVDTITPTIKISTNITAGTPVAAGKTVTVTFTLSEDASDFDLSDVKVAGGTLDGWSGAGKVYTAVFTPTDNSSTAASITVDANRFTDAFGNLNEAGDSIALVVDTILPTVVITSNKTKLAAGDVATLTFTLSEVSTDFTLDKIAVIGGTLSDFTGSGRVYTATFTPTADSMTSGEISVSANQFHDLAENPNIESLVVTIAIDTVVPTAVLVSEKDRVKKGETATITITMSEEVSKLALTDLTVVGGTLSNLSGSGTSYTVTFTPTTNSILDGVVTLNVGSFEDTAGNKNTAEVSTTIKVDTIPPTVAITMDLDSVGLGETATITFTLSEPSDSFDTSSVKVSGGTLSSVSGSGTIYTATFTPADNSVENGIITVDANAFTDLFGNPNESSVTASIIVDTVPPTATITFAQDQVLAVGDVAELTIVLSEASTDFVMGDLSVVGGTLSDFAGSGRYYTVVFTPFEERDIPGSVTIAANTFTDAAGNENAEEASITLEINTVAPTVEITADSLRLAAEQTTTVYFTLSKPSTDFEFNDITLAKADGTLNEATFTMITPTYYSVEFTPALDIHKIVTISVDRQKFTDEKGNYNAHGASLNFDVDTIRPTAPTVDENFSSIVQPVITGTAEPGNIVYVTINGITFVLETPEVAGSNAHVPWSLDTANGIGTDGNAVSLPDLADGPYDVQAYSVDSYGNQSPMDITFNEIYVDTRRPNPPMIKPYVLEDSSISGTAEPNTVVSILIKGTQTAVCSAVKVDQFGFWSCKPQAKFISGTVIEAKATDTALNTSLASLVTVKNRIKDVTVVNVFPTLGDTFSGQGQYSASIKVRTENNELICETYVNPLGLWECSSVYNAPEIGGSLIRVEQTYNNALSQVATHVIDEEEEIVPPMMNVSGGLIFDGTSIYRDGSVKIVVKTEGELCSALITPTSGAGQFDCQNRSSTEDIIGAFAYGYVSQHDGIYMSGLSAPIMVAGHLRDSDMDGRTDLEEWDCLGTGEFCIDSDEDGIHNYLDADDDGDGIPSILEDGDNYLNLDSDGDGIPDEIESQIKLPPLSGKDINDNEIDDAIDADITGGPDADNNGIDDTYQPLDSDGDGIPNFADPDSDGDTIPDVIEGTADTDGDKIPNYLDTDSDGDSIPDYLEAGTEMYIPTDVISVNKPLVNPVDTDGDFKPDYLDLDSDNDGVFDVIEGGGVDKDSNALIDKGQSILTKVVDTDGDGLPDFIDTDSNDDDISDLIESGRDLYVDEVHIDLDNDGVIDDATDLDNDGIADIIDGALGIYGSLPDQFEDFDGDGIPNRLDRDSDNDGILDVLEGNGDFDGDGRPNAYDLDSDNDGIPDVLEHFPHLAPLKLGYINELLDDNDDGFDDRIPEDTDLDFDNDYMIDSQDLDSDNDRIWDLVEAIGITELDALYLVDQDNDGIIDAINDKDRDGIMEILSDGTHLDTLDVYGFRPGNQYMLHFLKLTDTDGDGMRDFQDTDSDNDGYSDRDEYLVNPNPGNDLPYTKDSVKTSIKGNGAGSTGLLSMLLLLAAGCMRSVRFALSAITLVSGLLTLLPFSVAAETTTCGYVTPSGRFNDCWNISAGIGISYLSVEGESQGWYSEDPTYDPSVVLNIGYQMSPRLFTELSYQYLGEAELVNHYSAANPDAFGGKEGISYHAPSLSLGAYAFPYKPGQNFNLYGRVGVSTMFHNVTDDRIEYDRVNSVQFNLGAGLEYRNYGSPWFGRLDFVSFDEDAKNLSVQVGRYLGGESVELAPAPVLAKVEPIVVQLEKPKPEIVYVEVPAKVVPAPVVLPPQPVIEKLSSGSILDFFETGSSALGENGRRALSEMARTLRGAKDYKMYITGHTDSIGSAEANVALSLRRAESVKNYFVRYGGLDSSKIRVAGLGESRPVATNMNEAGRAKNRRVDIEMQYFK